MNRYTEIKSKLDIVHMLRQLLKNKEILGVSFNNGKSRLSTMLLNVYPEENRMVFDGFEDTVNQSIRDSVKVTFNGYLDGVKISFTAAHSKIGVYEGAPALSINLPASIQYFQTRTSFRVKAPSNTYCSVSPSFWKSLKLSVDELSVGGLSLFTSKDQDSFTIRQAIKNCQLDLGDFGKLECTLEVCSIKQTTNRIGAKVTSIGCRFVGLKANEEAILSRFITQQERRLHGRA